jgi:hypothetical protein
MASTKPALQEWKYSQALRCFVIGSPNPRGYRLHGRQLDAVFGMDQLGILWVGNDLHRPGDAALNFGHDLARALAWLSGAAR